MQKVLKIHTKNAGETRKLGEIFAKEFLRAKFKSALVVGLEGELGAGKTVFAKGFAKGLRIKEEMKSPTFILMRVFKIKKRNFFHLDAYRINSPKEFIALGFTRLLSNPSNIILIEWSDKIRKLLPKKYFRFVFKSGDKTSREITLYA